MKNHEQDPSNTFRITKFKKRTSRKVAVNEKIVDGNMWKYNAVQVPIFQICTDLSAIHYFPSWFILFCLKQYEPSWINVWHYRRCTSGPDWYLYCVVFRVIFIVTSCQKQALCRNLIKKYWKTMRKTKEQFAKSVKNLFHWAAKEKPATRLIWNNCSQKSVSGISSHNIEFT